MNNKHAVCIHRDGATAIFQIGEFTATVRTNSAWKLTFVDGRDAYGREIVRMMCKTSSHIQALKEAGCETVEFRV